MKFRDTVEPKLKFSIEEASGEVDGIHVLGKVKGQFFVPNGFSRNNRYYPKALWDKCITSESIQERLVNRRMFGTISHEQELDDAAIREGKVSHVMTKLYIDEEGRGCGESLILATPTGKVLNTMLRAGCGLFVSSRADGEYTGNKVEGVDEVDAGSYQLYGFDFVSEPGFLQANPKIAEALNEALKDIKNENKGEYNMDPKLFENLLTEKVKLEAELERAIDERKKALAEVANLQSSNATYSSDTTAVKEELEKVKKELEESKAAVEKATVELDANKVKLVEFEAIGEAKTIDKGLALAVKKLKEYKEIGTVEEIVKSVDMLEAFMALGTVEELKVMVESSNKLVTKILKEEEEEKIETVAVELEVPKEVIQKYLDKGVSIEDVKELIGDVLKDSEIEVTSEEGEEFEDEEEEEDDDISTLDKYESPELKDETDDMGDEEIPESAAKKSESRLSGLMESCVGRIHNRK